MLLFHPVIKGNLGLMLKLSTSFVTQISFTSGLDKIPLWGFLKLALFLSLLKDLCVHGGAETSSSCFTSDNHRLVWLQCPRVIYRPRSGPQTPRSAPRVAVNVNLSSPGSVGSAPRMHLTTLVSSRFAWFPADLSSERLLENVCSFELRFQKVLLRFRAVTQNLCHYWLTELLFCLWTVKQSIIWHHIFYWSTSNQLIWTTSCTGGLIHNNTS